MLVSYIIDYIYKRVLETKVVICDDRNQTITISFEKRRIESDKEDAKTEES